MGLEGIASSVGFGVVAVGLRVRGGSRMQGAGPWLVHIGCCRAREKAFTVCTKNSHGFWKLICQE